LITLIIFTAGCTLHKYSLPNFKVIICTYDFPSYGFSNICAEIKMRNDSSEFDVDCEFLCERGSKIRNSSTEFLCERTEVQEKETIGGQKFL
jgi:hypothetical protein